MNANKAKLGLTLLVVIVIFSALSLLYWDFIRDTVVTPIYYLLWFGDLTLKSIPQEVFLAVLIIVSMIISLNALGNARTKRVAQERERSRSTGVSRYLEWKRLCESQVSNQFVRNQFTWESRKLTLALLAYQEAVDIATAEEMVKNGDLEVPDIVRNLMRRQEIPVPRQAHQPFRNPFSRLRKLFPGVNSADDSPTDPLGDEIVAFIEQRLEIRNAGKPEGSN